MVYVADAIAHVMYFRSPLFLYHKQVMELQALLVLDQVNLAAHEVQERVLEVHKVQKEHQDHQRRLVSSPLSFSGVISWG